MRAVFSFHKESMLGTRESQYQKVKDNKAMNPNNSMNMLRGVPRNLSNLKVFVIRIGRVATTKSQIRKEKFDFSHAVSVERTSKPLSAKSAERTSKPLSAKEIRG